MNSIFSQISHSNAITENRLSSTSLKMLVEADNPDGVPLNWYGLSDVVSLKV
ncbi:hypothetical protein KY363_04795 [Candidatus Woesearchaeota archaeon]|nr:hypothetical protein [Candidatus Woesearchaeota archaeon]